MRIILFATVLILLVLSTHLSAENDKVAQLDERAKNLASQLGMQLKAQLQAAIKAGGPASAITVCKVMAPDIAENLSTDGWTVGRTSLKLRNPKNAPDEWENATLLAFEKRLAAGEPANDLQRSVINIEGTEKHYRFMKAIPIDGVCMACHGEAISGEVKLALTEKYPKDAATGYQPGELRGAFTITKILKKDNPN